MFENHGGNIITVGVLLLGFAIQWGMTRSTVRHIGSRLLEMEGQLKRLVDVLIEQGRHSERMTAMDQRVASQGARLDELANRFNKSRNGEG